jgi:anti-sigma B factor antagonist
MSPEAGSDLVVQAGPDPEIRIVEFRDRYLNYERTDELKPRLRRLIEAELATGGRRLLLDLAAVEVIDSCGLAILVSAGKLTRLAGGELALCGLSNMLARLFELTGLDAVFDIHATVADAAERAARDRVA